MKHEKLLALLTYEDENDIDEISMILSNHIDHGNSNGGLVSAKQFKSIAEQIIEWHKSKNKRGDYETHKI